MNYSVYFIYCGDQQNSPVKIGVTSDIDNRISNLQTGNPYVLVCKALIPCSDKEQAYKLESYLHNRFKKKRMNGEWFRLYGFNMKSILNDFSSKQTKPLPKQGFNVLKKATSKISRLERENKALKLKVENLERDIEEYLDIHE
ncbi:MAG: hypothetical protein Unbinned706contig1000_47 [Prokaryotic dsDNA virus sp.]|nr:MAG: hypothetical protein Unbinned706contig1000_47 [Prokaryotic dsDNA virus sp.]|tara:strand:+ start:37087 stop:37515 length:429 start_codon:yes stop_codon:yes gene_type:complete